MAIIYNPNKKIFTLHTAHTTYQMQVKNEPGVLAKVASVFGGHKVSIRRVVQKHVQEEAAELVISTEKVKEYHIKDALRELQKMDSISEISSMIREY